MGVCCVVFDIDGMLFKKQKLRIISSIFHVFFAFYAISNIYFFCFVEKHLFSFHFAFYAIFNITKQKEILKVPLHLLVKLEVVSPNGR